MLPLDHLNDIAVQCHLITREVLKNQVRDWQSSAVEAFLQCRDFFAIQPTGAGKTWITALIVLVFQKLKNSSNLIKVSKQSSVLYIVSPLLSVMQDQMNDLNGRNIPGLRGAAFGSLDGAKDLNNEHTRATRELIANGEVQVVWMTPEMVALLSKGNRWTEPLFSLVKQTAIGFVIDEVHLLLDAGDFWRPDYLALELLRPLLPLVPIGLMSASVPRSTLQVLTTRLRIKPDVVMLVGCTDRPNVFYKVVERKPIPQTFGHMRDDVSAFLLDPHNFVFNPNDYPVMIFANNRPLAGAIVDYIIGQASACPKIVAKFTRLSSETHKYEVLTLMKDGSNVLQIFVCTGAMGVGNNPPAIRRVIHFLPPDYNSYFQESGRVARNHGLGRVELHYRVSDFQPKSTDSNAVKLSKARDKHIFQFYIGVLLDEESGVVEVTCRRAVLGSHFAGTPYSSLPERCCDVCHPDLYPTPTLPPAPRKVGYRKNACRMSPQERVDLAGLLSERREALVAGIKRPQQAVKFAPQIVGLMCDDAGGMVKGTFLWPDNFERQWRQPLMDIVKDFLVQIGKGTTLSSAVVVNKQNAPSVMEMRSFLEGKNEFPPGGGIWGKKPAGKFIKEKYSEEFRDFVLLSHGGGVVEGGENRERLESLDDIEGVWNECEDEEAGDEMEE
ncbi:hypothetical protein HDU98_004986 [Podochytrium sp. JEL0797]|nr:hypothetical protein HDU98_004986 [Podochytrium sp. JEL0797]